MSKDTGKPAHGADHGKRLLSSLGRLLARLWALVILGLIAWTAYAAGAYMIKVVFTPAKLPADMSDWQANIPASALRTPGGNGAAAASVRAPLKHYHAVDRWFHPDPHNDCTTSGCHDPLAHTEYKETRAFANLHATFLSCEMCHSTDKQAYQKASWISAVTGRPQEPPAILQLMRDLALNADKIQAQPAELQASIVERLRSAVEVAEADPLLDYFLVQIQTSEPGSPIWRQTVGHLIAELPNHARGEYAAKLTPLRSQTQPAGPAMAELARKFLAVPKGDPARRELRREIHADVLTKPDLCLHCHAPRPEGMDFEAAGYWPARAEELSGLGIAQMIQHIREGQPFRYPNLLEGGAPALPPATQP